MDEFQETVMILFLTKKDLFPKKIKKIPITVCSVFSSFKGDTTDYDETLNYIADVFNKCNKSRTHKRIYVL